MKTVIAPIPAVNDFESQGKRLYNTIHIIKESDIDMSSLPEISDDARTMAALTLKQEAQGFVAMSFVKYTPSVTSEGSAGDITSTVNNTLTGTIGGDRAIIDDLLEGHLGEAFLVVVTDRFTMKKTIYGRPYSPMFLSAFSKRKGGDNTSCDVTFSNESFFQPLEYLGEVTK